MFTKITIKSNEPDYTGVYHKEDIEEEMKELDVKIEYPFDWILYLFDHVFFNIEDRINAILVAFAKLNEVEEIKIRGNDFWARIIKEK